MMPNPKRLLDALYGGAKAAKAAKSAPKQAPSTASLSAQERADNLAKFLEPSAVQMRLYHGTTATHDIHGKEAIRNIKPSKEGALGSGVYLTPKTQFANEYANPYIPGSTDFASGNVLPVYAQLRNPLVLEGKGDPMIEALTKLGIDEDKAARMVERAYENKGYIGKEVESRARAQGFDGLMQYRDGELSEVVSYNPSAIKSALGNEGTYDTSVPLLNKAEGGAVHMQDGGDPTQMFNFNPMAAKAAEQERRRREAVEAKRYKSVMGTTPQDLLRRVEPPPAEMTETPQSVMPTTLDRAVVGGLRALGAPAPQARGINRLLSKSVGMLVPDPERIYNQMSEAVKEDDYSKMIGPSIDAAIGYVPLIGPAARLAMPPVKAATTSALDFGRSAGREMLRPIDQAMFGEGPLATLMTPVAPLQAVPRVQAPVSKLWLLRSCRAGRLKHSTQAGARAGLLERATALRKCQQGLPRGIRHC